MNSDKYPIKSDDDFDPYKVYFSRNDDCNEIRHPDNTEAVSRGIIQLSFRETL